MPLDVIAELCGLATWAPNHKKTWPWRFAVFTGEGRSRLGDTMADEMERVDFGDDVKRAKTRTKYLRTPVTLVVGCAPHDNEMLHDENRDAVAAGIQNLLLGATALGLASFWSTPALTQPAPVLELCGFDPSGPAHRDGLPRVGRPGLPAAAAPAAPDHPRRRVAVADPFALQFGWGGPSEPSRKPGFSLPGGAAARL